MARKALPKTGELATSNLKNDNFYKAGIGKISPNGTVSEISKFLINPDSLEDVKNVNWYGHSVPGKESPVYQWVSGGPRLVSFEALVTKDSSYLEVKENTTSALLQNVVNAIGSIASNLAGVNIPLSGLLSTGGKLEDENTLSIENELAFYRGLYRPTINKGRLEASPPLVVLYLGNSLGNSESVQKGSISKNTELWMMTNLSIRITKWLPNLRPMEALVSFQFTEYKITDTTQA